MRKALLLLSFLTATASVAPMAMAKTHVKPVGPKAVEAAGRRKKPVTALEAARKHSPKMGARKKGGGKGGNSQLDNVAAHCKKPRPVA